MIWSPSLVVSITSDVLYPTYQQIELRDALVAHGLRSDFHLIDSPQGHDGFLLETERIGPLVADFLTTIEKSTPSEKNDA